MHVNANVVAAIDFSSISSVVIEHAVKIASYRGGSVLATHVLDESRLNDWIDTLGEDTSTENWLAKTKDRLSEVVAPQAGNCEFTIEVSLGRPYQKISEDVAATGAGLLVIGAHDQDKTRMGSVASKCIRAVPSDVLVLRDWQGRLFNKVAACVDFSETSARALEQALDFAEAHKASVEVIHVIFPPDNDPWGETMVHPLDSNVSYEKVVRGRAQRRLDAFLKPFADRLEKLDHSTLVLESHCPAMAISAHALSESTDLIVMGAQGRSWLGSLVLGSTAERLLNDAPSSVLVVRPPQDIK